MMPRARDDGGHRSARLASWLSLIPVPREISQVDWWGGGESSKRVGLEGEAVKKDCRCWSLVDDLCSSPTVHQRISCPGQLESNRLTLRTLFWWMSRARCEYSHLYSRAGSGRTEESKKLTFSCRTEASDAQKWSHW